MRPRNVTCKGCQRPTVVAQTDDEGLLALEVHESALGAGRYAIWDDGIARPVAAKWEGLAHQIHVCGEQRV